MELIEKIIFHDPRCNTFVKTPKWKFDALPPYKSLWNTPNTKGLPIGNLTSQFFSNVYLNVLDKFIKHVLKCKYYCRYVDDFVILDECPKRLNYCHREIAKFMQEKLLLTLHQDKKTIGKINKGIDFVGYSIKPNRMFLRKSILKKISKIKKYNCSDPTSKGRISSYLGLLKHTKGFNFRIKLLYSLDICK